MDKLLDELKKKNIALIGMPGAGKSTIGVVLAKRLGFSFLDSDLLIQETYGRLLYQIIEEENTNEILKVAEEKIKYLKNKNLNQGSLDLK